MTDMERQVLLGLLQRGVCSQFWVTRNYLVQNWDGTTEITRLMYPPEAGVAMLEGDLVRIEHQPADVDQIGNPHLVEYRRHYVTECAEHFVKRIIRFS